jgi:hypothetical protein
LRWTCKSTRQLADALGAQGFQVSDDTVGRLLEQQGYTLQRTQKTEEGAQHPDRDAQFRYVNEQAASIWPPERRSSVWTPRRRSWSAGMPTAARSGSRPASPSAGQRARLPDPTVGRAIP